MNIKGSRVVGWGQGYCYWRSPRALIVVADNLQTVRECVATTMRLRATRPYPGNPARSAYILTSPTPINHTANHER